jgi:hypothetical protein
MSTGYRRRNREFEAKLSQRADELREKREAEQIAELVRDVQDELVPVLIILWKMQDEREGA